MSGKKLKFWRVRFSLRSFFVFVAFLAVYLASWIATKEYGIAPGTAQYTPIPFLIVDSGVPHFSNISRLGEPLVMEQKRTYYLWVFGKQQVITERNLVRKWNGHSVRERRGFMKEIATSYGQSIIRNKIAQ